MKKNRIFWMFAVLMLVVGMSSCSKDDDIGNDDIGNDDIDNVDIVNNDSVRGGEVYDGWVNPEVDMSDPLAVFFRDELHSPYWDGQGNEIKTFFEQGEWDDKSCLMINSRQEFQDAYMGTKELPDVDFSNYTLIIGRVWGNDTSYKLNSVLLTDMTENYELETKMLHYVDRLALLTAVIIYYWRLYPKLEKKDIIVKRTVENVNG